MLTYKTTGKYLEYIISFRKKDIKKKQARKRIGNSLNGNPKW